MLLRLRMLVSHPLFTLLTLNVRLEIGIEMEKLRMKASEKISDFFYKKIDSLKTPNTNISITQKSVLLKYKELYYFLMERYVDVANEVKINYVSVGIFA